MKVFILYILWFVYFVFSVVIIQNELILRHAISIAIGIVNICLIMVLIFLNKENLKEPSERLIFLSGVFFFPGFAGIATIGYSPLWQELSGLLFFIGIALFIAGQIFKNFKKK